MSFQNPTNDEILRYLPYGLLFVNSIQTQHIIGQPDILDAHREMLHEGYTKMMNKLTTDVPVESALVRLEWSKSMARRIGFEGSDGKIRPFIKSLEADFLKAKMEVHGTFEPRPLAVAIRCLCQVFIMDGKFEKAPDWIPQVGAIKEQALRYMETMTVYGGEL